MKPEVHLVSLEDDLESLVGDINAARWDAANDIVAYDVNALLAYLHKTDVVFVACYLVEGESRTFAGMASGRLEHKPYDFEKWLYIDEVDTCSDLRQRGVGTAMMKWLLQFADENDCDEVWLGTEVENDAANALYKSLRPSSIDAVVGYTFELED